MDWQILSLLDSGKKFAMKIYDIIISTHLKRVATLPCKVFKNSVDEAQ